MAVKTLTTRKTKDGPRPYADGKPRYEVRVRRPGGRELSKTFRTKVEAQRWEREFLSRRDRGEVIEPNSGRVLLADYVPTWLDGRRISPRTRYEYDGLLRRSILPVFGAERLTGITGEAVAAWHVKLADGEAGGGGEGVPGAVVDSAFRHEGGAYRPQSVRSGERWRCRVCV